MPQRLLTEVSMKALFIAGMLALAAAPSYAQQGPDVYARFAGGFAVSPDGTSGDLLGEVGVHITPHLSVFGDLGQFHNLQPSQAQPAVDAVTSTLANGGLSVTGEARVPAWYSLGGLRWTMPVNPHVSPYVFGGAGFARMTPTATFTYSSGTLVGALNPPVSGDDVTSQIVSLGDYTQAAASTSFMYALGGGIEAPIAGRLVADVGYRVSRVSSETPVTAQSVTFGVGYRF
jgi:opacity protein-like surface antigen